jgi:cytochrome o ubiquinol oxidase subunit 1
MPRRVYTYQAGLGWDLWNFIATIGAYMIGLSVLLFIINVVRSIRAGAVAGDNPWNAPTLEWATSSPPPAYNFAFTPIVYDHDAWWDMKNRGYVRPTEGFIPIHMPKNTGTGVILSALSVVCGFAMIWYIWWLAALSFIAVLAVAIGHTFNYHRDYHVPADEVVRTEDARTHLLASGA